MELKSFAEAVAEKIQKNLGENYYISVLTTLKNNSTEYTGISFQKKEDVISPTIYVDDLYLKSAGKILHIVWYLQSETRQF